MPGCCVLRSSHANQHTDEARTTVRILQIVITRVINGNICIFNTYIYTHSDGVHIRFCTCVAGAGAYTICWGEQRKNTVKDNSY